MAGAALYHSVRLLQHIGSSAATLESKSLSHATDIGCQRLSQNDIEVMTLSLRG